MKFKTLCLIFSPLVLFGVKSVQLPTLPCGELPNSEVVTNVALNVDYARLENLTFSLELNASASNSLSIAVGTAAGDAMTLDEADFEWGYDCGKWFRADTETGNVDEWPEPGTGRVSRTLTINRSDFKPQWNRLRIVKRGVGDVEVDAGGFWYPTTRSADWALKTQSKGQTDYPHEEVRRTVAWNRVWGASD